MGGGGGPALEEHLVRQALAVLLYSRRVHRASRPALDVLGAVMEAVMLKMWRQTVRCGELNGLAQPNFLAVYQEILRQELPRYHGMRELLEYVQTQPALEAGSLVEERGLVNGQLKLLPDPRVDQPLEVILSQDFFDVEGPQDTTPPSS